MPLCKLVHFGLLICVLCETVLVIFQVIPIVRALVAANEGLNIKALLLGLDQHSDIFPAIWTLTHNSSLQARLLKK